MPTQSQLDEYARKEGFHDYATMVAYQARERARITGRSNAGTGDNSTAPPAKKPVAGASGGLKGFFDSLAEHITNAMGGG